MRVSTGPDVSSAPSIEQSAMVSGCGRGRGLGRYFGGRECGSYLVSVDVTFFETVPYFST